MSVDFTNKSESSDTSLKLAKNFFEMVPGHIDCSYELPPPTIGEGNTTDESETVNLGIAEGSTNIDEIDILGLTEIVKNLFRNAENENFEDGMDNNFSMGLQNIINIYGNLALIIVSRFILEKEASVEVISETLCLLGRFEQLETHKNRLRILEKCLQSASSYIRDSAGLGISYMDDPASIPQLKKAIEGEANPELKEDLELVLYQLENNN